MPSLSVLFGAALAALGLAAYFNPAPFGVSKDGKPAEAGHPTSLIPAGIGGVLVAAGVASLASPGVRKHAMHAAAAAGLLGAVGGFFPAATRGFRIEEVAVKVGLGMAVLSAVFVALCVNSFVQARKARQAATADPVV